MEHHTLLHAEKSFNCAFCEMSFLKRSELGRHINSFHQSDVIQKYGIIDRITAVGKSHDSPYLRKPNNFNGYKSKELIQHAPTTEDTSTPNHDADNHRKLPTSNKDRTPHTAKWSAYSVSSSCYSRAITPKSRYGDDDDGYGDEEDCIRVEDDTQDSTSFNNGNGSFIRRPMPPGPLELFDVFSIDALGMDEEPLRTSTPSVAKSLTPPVSTTNTDEPIRNGNGHDIDDGDHLQLPRRKNNRSLIAFHIDLFDKYIPPYDELFEKYLDNRKFDEEPEMVAMTAPT